MTTSLTRKFFSRKIAFLALLVVVMLTTIQPSHSLVVVRPFSRNVRRSTGARFARLASVRPDLEQGQNMFDSSSSSSSSHDLKTTDQESSLPSLEEEQDGEMSLWMARSILLLVAAIWGTNFASVKYLENLCFHPPCHHPPSEFALARFGVAGLVSIPLLLGKRWDVILGGFECGLWITLGYVSQAMALATISSGKCAFICSLTVVFVPVVSALLYGRPIKQTDVLAGLVAISGVAILEGMLDVQDFWGAAPALAHVGSGGDGSLATALPELASSSSSSVDIAAAGPIAKLATSIGIDKGSLLALGQPVGFGFAFTRIEATQEKFKQVPDRVLTIAAAQCVSVGILSFLWVLYDYHGVVPYFGYMIEWHRIATILWTGIITTVVAIYLEGIALQKATATDASIAFSSEPVWASLFGYLLLGENLGLNAYVGGTVIMTACLIGALGDVAAGGSSDEDEAEP